MNNIKLYIAYFAFGIQILVFGSCQSLDEKPLEIHGLIDAAKGTAVLSLFEEIDLIALALIQHESVNDRLLSLTVDDFCKETQLIKNEKEKSVTADFGDGCMSSKGVKREGVIKVINSTNFWSKGNVTQIILDGFYIDGVKVSGIRSLTNNGFDLVNRQFNFESVMHNGFVTWPSEEPLLTEYLHDRTIYLPTKDSGFTFSLMGKTEIKDQKGNSLLAEIIKPMVFREDCMVHGIPSASSGSLAIKRGHSDTVLVNFNNLCK